jgi:hypothetical protein
MLDEPEKVKLLLSSEYKNLSDQIISRFHGQQQIYRLGAALGGALVSAYLANYIQADVFFPIAFIVLSALVFLWLDMDRDIAKAATRIREIEDRVNRLAGEDLLLWETKKGRGGVIGKHLVSPESSD